MYRQDNRNHINQAADHIARGDVIGFFFKGTYALLGDADQAEAGDKIFEIKSRPRSKTLSLITDPRYWAEFIALSNPTLSQFPLSKISALFQHLHALGIVYPADVHSAPTYLVQNQTILNVWTDYEPLIGLQQACRQRGLRAFLAASANLSGEPTYTKLSEMERTFRGKLPLIFGEDEAVSPSRQKSTSLVDLTQPNPTLVREGNVPESEVRAAFEILGLGPLAVSENVKRL